MVTFKNMISMPNKFQHLFSIITAEYKLKCNLYKYPIFQGYVNCAEI